MPSVMSLFRPLFFTALFFICFSLSSAAAQPNLPPSVIDEGGLFFPGDKPGTVTPAPLLKTEIDAAVSGPVVRYKLRHTFMNTSKQWSEAIYTFPLPSDSAVDRLKMTIGDRVVNGRIEEKSEARRLYNQAKSNGQRASIVEQQRPNIFTTSLANIAPGEQITVEIGFQETLRMRDGGFRLRMPLVVGPRFIPGSAVDGFKPTGWAPPTDEVGDAHLITPPVRTVEEGPGNPVSLNIDLDAGFPLAMLESPSHELAIEKLGNGRARITINDTVPADKDFTLVWKARAGDAPAAGLFAETVNGTRYALLMLSPPVSDQPPERTPRDLVFVVDTSGSMHGASIDQAKAALRLALDRLSPNDGFRIIRFSNTVSSFRPAKVMATSDNIAAAKEYVGALEAEGGTEIVKALSHALAQQRSRDRLTQVVLLTDGAVGNEQALFDVIDRQIGKARLFTVGIGTAPNGYLMTRAAHAGRGTFTFIENIDEVAERMTALFTMLETPALTDVTLDWRGGNTQAETWPNPVPDLYLGEPVTVLSALGEGTSAVDVTGRIGGKVWRTQVPVISGQERPGVAALWARQKIRGLEDRMRWAEDRDAVKADIINTALQFELVSRFTSLVAIDDFKARPDNLALASAEVPTNMPEGWSRDHVMGEPGQPIPQPGPQKTRTFDRASPLLRQTMSKSANRLANVPQTATPAPLALLFGGLLLVCGWAVRRFGAGRA
ncbi:MAG: marine proteobacterial sortase target protein [Rhodospirillales bacterium]|nr:marine proteobacterial sortase target protein [Rhodospirillales bacterium]